MKLEVSLEKLKKLQEELAKKVVLRDIVKVEDVQYVIGVDQSFIAENVISACVLLSFPTLRLVKSSVSIERLKFPYIPTFLMFREGNPAVRAVKSVLNELNSEGRKRSVIVVDGSGVAHPRRCGLASYVALKLKTPSIGVTKKRLYGEVFEPEKEMQSFPILDGEEVIGYALKSCKKCKPIYISPGSYITPQTALLLVKKCIKRRRLPEPIRIAHNLANKVKLELK
jgi:deoxyribonuclease V